MAPRQLCFTKVVHLKKTLEMKNTTSLAPGNGQCGGEARREAAQEMASKKRRREQPLTLRCLGFCGVDDSVEPALLSAISAQHNWVEWGVLFRPEKAGSPRFASDAWLERLRAVNGSRTMRLAAHLCSRRVNDLLRGDATFVRWLYEHLGFRRVQINATKANGADMKAFASSAAATRLPARTAANSSDAARMIAPVAVTAKVETR